MAKNDTFFKILFSIEIALLPMVIFAEKFLPKWAMSLFIAGILLAKIWLELFKDKSKKSHIIIDSVGSILVFCTLIIYFMVLNLIAKPLGIVVLLLLVLENLFMPLLFNRRMPEFIEAVDFCYMLFECFVLVAFSLLKYYNLTTNIGLFALLLTTLVSVAYKIYFIFRQTEIFSKFTHKK